MDKQKLTLNLWILALPFGVYCDSVVSLVTCTHPAVPSYPVSAEEKKFLQMGIKSEKETCRRLPPSQLESWVPALLMMDQP